MSESQSSLALQDLGVAAGAPPDGASHLLRLPSWPGSWVQTRRQLSR